MPFSPEDLFARLAELGIATETVEHPPVFTVEESRTLHGQLPGGHTKNLFVKDKKGRLFLVVARQNLALDLKKLHETIGASGRLSFASAELLLEKLGVTPGSVCAFAAINDQDGSVTAVIDAGLLEHETIYAHPLRNTMTTAIARDDLLRFLRATGHEPLVAALPERMPAQEVAGPPSSP